MRKPASAIGQLALLQLDSIAELPESKIEPPTKKRTGRPIKDLTGQRFGRLVVEQLTDERQHGNPVYICRCDCGTSLKLTGANFRSGTKSCGCLGFGRHRHAYRRGGIGSSRASSLTYERQEAQNRLDLYRKYRSAAVRRNYDWSLTIEEFTAITARHCHYCGAPPTQEHIGRQGYTDGKPYIYNGIDRTDNAKGYEAGNVVPCCGVCNQAKMDRNYDEFIEWARRIVEHINVA